MSSQQTVGQIANKYEISLAAVAKHITVLEKARLVAKQRRGKEQLVSIVPKSLKDASRYLLQYEVLWTNRFEEIDRLLKETK
jgi:DNA-binding transcriptional ArsR family regulator